MKMNASVLFVRFRACAETLLAVMHVIVLTDMLIGDAKNRRDVKVGKMSSHFKRYRNSDRQRTWG